MKKTVKAILSACLALILALSSLPFAFTANAAEPQPTWTVPEGYNAHDYNKCVEFLEQTDEEGVKNGEKLSESYDPNDPNTWGTATGPGFLPNPQPVDRFRWIEQYGELRIYRIDLDSNIFNPDLEPLGGILDVSGCSKLFELKCSNNQLVELDISDCIELEWLDCGGNQIAELNIAQNTELWYLSVGANQLTELDVSNNPHLYEFNCGGNQLTELDLSHNAEIRRLRCGDNQLTELDLSHNPYLWDLDCRNNMLTELDVSRNLALQDLDCSGNRLTELDLSNNAALEDLICHYNLLTELDLSNNSLLADHIFADGMGYIGYCGGHEANIITALPHSGAEFTGFYSEDGELVSEGEWDDVLEVYTFTIPEDFPIDAFIARFSGGSAVTPGDVDGSGSVTTADAIAALRLALQLIDGSGMNVDAADMDGNGAVSIADAIMILRVALGL